MQQLMKALGLLCLAQMKKCKSYKGAVGKIVYNLIEHDFAAAQPNLEWVSNVTEFHLFGRKLYPSSILDLHSRANSTNKPLPIYDGLSLCVISSTSKYFCMTH